MLRFLLILLTIFTFFNGYSCLAKAIAPRQYGTEGRFKTWTYYPDSVYYYTGYYLRPSYIEFEAGETVTSIASPKPKHWQWNPAGNRLFIKPVMDDADTTATIMTSKRVYFFEMHAAEAKGPFDRSVHFYVKFTYPPAPASGDETSVIEYMSSDLPDLSHPELYNFNYSTSGDDLIKPIMAFDDGKFTYLKFRDKNTVLPAVFGVDQEGYEMLVNFRTLGDYIIVESIARIFTLRNGPATVCIFNETLMQKSESIENLKPSLIKKILGTIR